MRRKVRLTLALMVFMLLLAPVLGRAVGAESEPAEGETTAAAVNPSEERGAAAAGAASAAAVSPREAGEQDAARSGRAALEAVIDPETGELLAGPFIEDLETLAPLDRRYSTYVRDLYEVPLEKGGYIVDLRGRFRRSLVVEIGEDGEVKADCVPGHVSQHEAVSAEETTDDR